MYHCLVYIMRASLKRVVVLLYKAVCGSFGNRLRPEKYVTAVRVEPSRRQVR